MTSQRYSIENQAHYVEDEKENQHRRPVAEIVCGSSEKGKDPKSGIAARAGGLKRIKDA